MRKKLLFLIHCSNGLRHGRTFSLFFLLFLDLLANLRPFYPGKNTISLFSMSRNVQSHYLLVLGDPQAHKREDFEQDKCSYERVPGGRKHRDSLDSKLSWVAEKQTILPNTI